MEKNEKWYKQFTEILETFSSPSDFGSVKIEVTYHNGKPVVVDCEKSIKRKV